MAKDGGDAESYRLEGNEHFRSSRYHNAISSYTKSLKCSKTSAVLSNRAQAYLNTKQYAKALVNLQLYEVAMEMISKIEQLDPNNKEVARLKESAKDKPNCSELRLSCLKNKDEFLCSKVPLKEIRNIEVIKSVDRLTKESALSTSLT
ncbi:unnamed protein product [Gongylonema pulchrum]|uniref:TPR_REGION domain-containing protein n=1 Tax=Gongylonema pulchrum TaxID=637853 RepID=A0A183E2K7_9BILA|nr:unnamed protein product [Gongylonema pulchrum]